MHEVDGPCIKCCMLCNSHACIPISLIYLSLDSHRNVMNLLYKRPIFTFFSVLYLTKTFVVETTAIPLYLCYLNVHDHF